MTIVSRPCPDRKLLLHCLADGELDAANAFAVEEHVAACEGCKATYETILRTKKVLGGEALHYSAPEALRNNILAQLGDRPSAVRSRPKVSESTGWWRRALTPSQGFGLAASCFAVALIVFSGHFYEPSMLPQKEVVSSHVRSLLASHLTDVASTDQHTVKPWFLGKLDFSPPVIDLSDLDFPLTGGRLDYVDGGVVPALVYKRRGHVINVFVWPSAKSPHVKDGTGDGYNVLSWSGAGFVFVAVSDLNTAELRAFRNAYLSRVS